MCGFVGEFRTDGGVDRDRLYRMSNALLHRGPDESQILVSPERRWGVGHRRLCVVDIAGGRQPMVDPVRENTIVYNGEIYGHDCIRAELSKRGFAFHTNSDTEVVLALYAAFDLDFVNHLRGEFAFAIIDQSKRRAVLVRDRLGLKPLFYCRTAKGFVFGSEVKALLRHPDVPRRLDPTGLTAAIAVADTPGDTVFENIKQLKHAHWMTVDLDTLDVVENRYWDAWTNRRTDIPRSFDDQKALVRQEVDRAIDVRLRADVPIGAYLSGGLDSSLVAASMASKVDSLDAFALVFEDSPKHNELPYAQAVAAKYSNIRLHRIPVTYNDMIRRLPETVWHLERPFGNLHSVAKIMSAQYARNHVVCVLTGDGGDEAFCGYSTFWLQNELQLANYSLVAIKDKVHKMRREAREIGGNRYYLSGGLARRISSKTDFLQARLGFRPVDLATAIDGETQIRKLMDYDFRNRIEGTSVERLVDHLATTMPSALENSHAELLQYVQLNSQVPGYIATIADRSEWAGSVEARPPLFDQNVVELAMGLPLESKLSGDREKHVLREAYRDLLPDEVIERRKQAFLAPPAPFDDIDGKLLIERYLNPKAIVDAGIWNPRAVQVVRTLRRISPSNRIVNLTMTILITAQILHQRFIEGGAT